MKNKFDFNDILIIPAISTKINSRYGDIDPFYYDNRKYTKNSKFLPLFTAPMDTVVNKKNANLFLSNGVQVTLPRTIKIFDIFPRHLTTIDFKNVFFSVGFKDLDFFSKRNYKALPLNLNLLIDVANGHMEKISRYVNEIRKYRHSDIKIMVGNIGNPKTYKWYVKHSNVNYIRVGIGNGGGCLTTKNSGIGYPMASLIHETRKTKEKLLNNGYREEILPKIVADGGIKEYADIVKALGLGADYVMMGSVFNKALESAGYNYFHKIKISQNTATWLYNHGYTVKKYFRGMSTKEAQKAMGVEKIKTSEGVIRYRNVEYTLEKWTENFIHYLRNAMSYSNAKNLTEFIGKANFITITKNAYERFDK